LPHAERPGERATACRGHLELVRSAFNGFASWVSERVGSYRAFLVALATVLVWGASGPLFHFSDSWQLVINTGTTIVTFLMVFLIQATQNRETRALHLKLDELIRTQSKARNIFASLERATDEELDELETEFRKLRARTVARREARAASNGK
jgi:low affinity Fe/Cu permease